MHSLSALQRTPAAAVSSSRANSLGASTSFSPSFPVTLRCFSSRPPVFPPRSPVTPTAAAGAGAGAGGTDPPSDRCRSPAWDRFLEEPTPEEEAAWKRVAMLLIAAQGGIFLMWQASKKDPVAMQRMDDRWTSSMRNLREGRWYTLLTANISHSSTTHFLFNMFVLHSFFPLVAASLGARRTALLCLGSALSCSAMHIAFNNYLRPYVLNRPPRLRFVRNPTGAPEPLKVLTYDVPAVGFSGVLYGMIVAMALVRPNMRLQFLFVPVGIAAKYIVPGVCLFDLVASVAWDNSPLGHWGHLGGATFALVYWLTSIRGTKRPPRLVTPHIDPADFYEVRAIQNAQIRLMAQGYGLGRQPPSIFPGGGGPLSGMQHGQSLTGQQHGHEQGQGQWPPMPPMPPMPPRPPMPPSPPSPPTQAFNPRKFKRKPSSDSGSRRPFATLSRRPAPSFSNLDKRS